MYARQIVRLHEASAAVRAHGTTVSTEPLTCGAFGNTAPRSIVIVLLGPDRSVGPDGENGAER